MTIEIPVNRNPRKHQKAALLALIILIWTATTVYLPPYLYSFFQDDYKHLEFIQGLIDAPWSAYQVFSPYWIGWYYRPTQHLIFLFNFLAHGLNPVGYYLLQICLHSINIALLYSVSRRLKAGYFGALVAACLFALNQINQDVTGWISSVSVALAATFALLAVYAYATYLDTGKKAWGWLIISVVSAIFALLSREASIALPFLLVGLWLLWPGRQRPNKAEWISLSFLTVIVISYVYFQGVRPTWTIGGADWSAGALIQSIKDLAPLTLPVRVAGRFLAADSLLETASEPLLIVAGISLAAFLFLWFRKGGLATRYGLLWGLAYLTFVYFPVALGYLPLFSRYLYDAWAGFSLALGATAGIIARRSRLPLTSQLVIAGILFVLLLLLQGPRIKDHQQNTLRYLETMDSIRLQLFEMLPEPPDDAHFFALDLPSPEDFIHATVQVWYDRVFPQPGGNFNRLKRMGSASDSTFLLHYEEGNLHNLLPELEAGTETVFIWSEEPEAQVIQSDGTTRPLDPGSFALYQVEGSPEDRRLSFFLHPPSPEHGSSALSFDVNVPDNSELRFAILRKSGGLPEEDGLTFRVSAIRGSGEARTLFEGFIEPRSEPGPGDWQDVVVPMNRYWGESIELRLEVFAGSNLLHDHGYWANPRFTIDES